MGRRSPVIVVKNKQSIQQFIDYCNSTKDKGDIECYYAGYKYYNFRYYICIDTYSMGLEELNKKYPNHLITSLALITGGRDHTGEYHYRADHIIPKNEWNLLVMNPDPKLY